MLKRDVTYEDFNGEKKTETFYFNLSRTEMIELEAKYPGGFSDNLKKVAASNDNTLMFVEFKKVILLAYGIKSEDGRRFVKTDENRDEFSQTAAFDALMTEVSTNENLLLEFLNGVFPKDVVAEIQRTQPNFFPTTTPPNNSLPSPPPTLPIVDPFGPSGVKE